VQVGVRVLGHVIVEHNVDTLDVHAAAKQVRRHQDALLEVLELLVTVQAVHRRTRVQVFSHKIQACADQDSVLQFPGDIQDSFF